jgi:hypothetical protein
MSGSVVVNTGVPQVVAQNYMSDSYATIPLAPSEKATSRIAALELQFARPLLDFLPKRTGLTSPLPKKRAGSRQRGESLLAPGSLMDLNSWRSWRAWVSRVPRLAVAAVLLLVAHLALLVLFGHSRSVGVWSDCLQLALVLFATVVCFLTARRSTGIARPFRYLTGSTLASWSLRKCVVVDASENSSRGTFSWTSSIRCSEAR